MIATVILDKNSHTLISVESFPSVDEIFASSEKAIKLFNII